MFQHRVRDRAFWFQSFQPPDDGALRNPAQADPLQRLASAIPVNGGNLACYRRLLLEALARERCLC